MYGKIIVSSMENMPTNGRVLGVKVPLNCQWSPLVEQYPIQYEWKISYSLCATGTKMT